MSIKTTIITATAALALSLSSAAIANEVYSETATGMHEAAIRAMCNGEQERHLAMHNQNDLLSLNGYGKSYAEKLADFHQECQEKGIANIETNSNVPDAVMQQQKRRFPVGSVITMNDGTQYTYRAHVIWGAFRPPEGTPGVQAWRLFGFTPDIPRAK